MDLKKKKFAIVQSEYYANITEAMVSDAISYLLDQGCVESNVHLYKVPGAVEIPLAALWCAKQDYDGIVVFGCVIQGETKHFDYVCNQVNQGCQKVMMDYALPVIFGVLTTNTEQQALERVFGPVSHTGLDCAIALLKMVQLEKCISNAGLGV